MVQENSREERGGPFRGGRCRVNAERALDSKGLQFDWGWAEKALQYTQQVPYLHGHSFVHRHLPSEVWRIHPFKICKHERTAAESRARVQERHKRVVRIQQQRVRDASNVQTLKNSNRSWTFLPFFFLSQSGAARRISSRSDCT